ncbi:MAG: nitroreductase family protein [Nitrospirota bacterium]
MLPDDTVFSRNDTLRTIRDRHSVRTFTRDDVNDEEIKVLLHAANAAPSAHNQQTWRFIVLRGGKKQELAQLVTEQSAAFPRPAAALLRMGAKSIISAPVVIAVANTGDLISHGTELFKVDKDTAYDFFRTMEIQSSAAAVENILLAATSLGLGTVWLGVLYLIKDEVLRFLGEPEGEFMAVVPVGRPARIGGGPLKQPVEMKVRSLS